MQMDSCPLTYLVRPNDKYVFLRDVLRSEMQISRSLLIKLKQQDKIRVNGLVTLTNYRLKPGDLVTVDLNLDEQNRITPEPIPFDIVYEDSDLLAINKPAGLAVHPAKGTAAGTLANATAYYWQQQGKANLFRPINRLDKDTSGLILIGKSQYAHQAISRQQRAGTIHRIYQAVVEGVLEPDNGSIDLPIALRDPDARERTVDPSGKTAITDYTVISRFECHTLVSLSLRTGRTHQIRVHMSHLGHPIVGDALYGSPSDLIGRQALHAGALDFHGPRTGEALHLEAPLPEDMVSLLHKLKPLAE